MNKWYDLRRRLEGRDEAFYTDISTPYVYGSKEKYLFMRVYSKYTRDSVAVLTADEITMCLTNGYLTILRHLFEVCELPVPTAVQASLDCCLWETSTSSSEVLLFAHRVMKCRFGTPFLVDCITRCKWNMYRTAITQQSCIDELTDTQQKSILKILLQQGCFIAYEWTMTQTKHSTRFIRHKQRNIGKFIAVEHMRKLPLHRGWWRHQLYYLPTAEDRNTWRPQLLEFVMQRKEEFEELRKIALETIELFVHQIVIRHELQRFIS